MAIRFVEVRHLESTTSTNRVVAEAAAAGAPEGLVVVADYQTAGRGRLDRRWEAAPGDALLVSVLLRPGGLAVERWHLLSEAAALSASAACAAVAGVEARIKWPNDLQGGEGGAKLAGILAESAEGGVVVGMGLNVHAGPPGAAVLDNLAGRRVSRSDLLAAWLGELDQRLDDLDGVADDYSKACDTVGRRVRVDRGAAGVLLGVATRVDSSGRLVVRPDAGSDVALTVGDVTHIR